MTVLDPERIFATGGVRPGSGRKR